MTTLRLCANPRQISGDVVLWKERWRDHADGSGSPRRAQKGRGGFHSEHLPVVNEFYLFKVS